jgi:hypothetical protein
MPVSLERSGVQCEGRVDLVVAQALPDGRLFKVVDTAIPPSLSTDVRTQLLGEGLTLNRSFSVRPDAHPAPHRRLRRQDRGRRVGHCSGGPNQESATTRTTASRVLL